MNKKGLLVGGAIIVALGLIFIGKFIGGESTLVQQNTRNVAATAFNTTFSGKVAPDFSLMSLDGETITLSQFRGEKPVVLDFFATWCPNCRRDMPKLSRLYNTYKDEVEVIGINLQEKESKVRDYILSAGISFPIVLDPFQQTARSYGVQYTNYHVLIGKDGTILGIVPGDISEAHILSLIDSS